MIASLRSLTNLQTPPSPISKSPSPAPQNIAKNHSSRAKQDDWIVSSSRALAEALKVVPAADSTPLIKVQWEVFKEVFKDSIGKGTDLMALEDVSFQFCFTAG